MSHTIDQLTFGSWWDENFVDAAEVDGWTLRQLAYANRVLPAYLDLLTALGWPGEPAGAARALLRRAYTRLSALSSGPGPNRAIPADERPNPEWPVLTSREVEQVIEAVVDAVHIMGGNLERLASLIHQKWALKQHSINDVFQAIADAVTDTEHSADPIVSPVSFEWRVALAPPTLEPLVDMAMFIPTPPGTPRLIVVSSVFAARASTDVLLASRLPLAVLHELFGHAAQFDHVQRHGGHAPDEKLDRELLEGRATLAERGLCHLGDPERSLYLLYRVKRLLPVVRVAHPELWTEISAEIDRAWPGFFSDPSTSFLRRSIGTHSRGLARAERLMRERGGTSGLVLPDGLVSPWRHRWGSTRMPCGLSASRN